MSRTNQPSTTTRPLIQITSITFNVNGVAQSDGLADVFKICTLIGQQMQRNDDNPNTSTNHHDAPETHAPTAQAPPTSMSEEVDAVAADPSVWDEISVEIPSKKCKKTEYVNLHNLVELSSPAIAPGSTYVPVQKARRYRLVPSKKLRPVPEDELPKKKFGGEKKRREYVVLGRINSLEPCSSERELN